MAVHSDKEDGKSLLRKLSANPNVIGASLNRKYHACSTVNTPNDPDYYRLWGMEAINALYAWQYSTGSSDVYVIVMDSGVDYEHEDLRDNFSHKYSANFMNDQKNFSDNRMEYYDRKGHGTHCAGTIAAVGNNGLGVPGVNWRAKIIAVRVLDAEGWCSSLELVAGINYIAGFLAAKPDLNVAAVNISIGEENKKSPEEMIAGYDPLYLVLKLLSDMNRVVICVSAGNENSEVGAPNFDINGKISQGYYTYPPSYTGIDNMIAVAAANSDRKTRHKPLDLAMGSMSREEDYVQRERF